MRQNVPVIGCAECSRLRAEVLRLEATLDEAHQELQEMGDQVAEALRLNGLAVSAEKSVHYEGKPGDWFAPGCLVPHRAECGTLYRGCAPGCPKALWERETNWEIN